MKKQAAISHLQQHFKFYGFIRNYFTYDSRESMAGLGDMYYFQPYDNAWNQTEAEAAVSGIPREDLTAVSSFRFLSLTTRAGVNIVDYKWHRTEFSGTIEADFYAGLTTKGSHPVTGTALLRLRHAYITLGWDSLPILRGRDYARIGLTFGQTWHPMAADLCDVLALETGAPFGPFNRSPQVRMDARLGRLFTLTAAGLWQMQYCSIGPDGQSADYILYSKTPEVYLGISVHDNGFLMRAGADMLSISPRRQTKLTDPSGKTVMVGVKERLTTVSPFLYLQYQQGEFSIKAKTIFAEAGEHMNINGGYGVKAVRADGSWEYTPARSSATWISLLYGGKVGRQEDKHPQKLQGLLFGGFVRNFGTKEPLLDADNDGIADEFYYPRDNTMNRMYRISAALLWSLGKFQLGCEWEMTSAQYGTAGVVAATGLGSNGLHWVTNHRVQLMTKYNF